MLILGFIRNGTLSPPAWTAASRPSNADLQDIVRMLKAKARRSRRPSSPSTRARRAGKAFLDMLGVFAEFETNQRRERQLEGEGRGVYRGRKPSIDPARIAELKAQGLGATEIAKQPRHRTGEVYRVLEERA